MWEKIFKIFIQNSVSEKIKAYLPQLQRKKHVLPQSISPTPTPEFKRLFSSHSAEAITQKQYYCKVIMLTRSTLF